MQLSSEFFTSTKLHLHTQYTSQRKHHLPRGEHHQQGGGIEPEVKRRIGIAKNSVAKLVKV